MRILVISLKVGESAVGIVFENLIQGLSKLHEIDVLTADDNPSMSLSQVSNIIFLKRPDIHPRIRKMLISLFGIDPYDWYWGWKSKKLIKARQNNQYDIILSFLCNHYYATIIAGKNLAESINSKYAVHTLDAVPNPLGWSVNNRYYKNLKKLVAKYLKNVDGLFSINDQMLDYQLGTFAPKKNLITNVIYCPGQEEIKEFPIPDIEIHNFVYTGGIYGVRKSTYILKAFEKLLDEYPASKLIFVGSRLSPDSLADLKSETINKIDFIPFTRDLDPYYKCATALIDINADIENDVFLSSKVTTYVMINRIIICETGINSPARHLFKSIDSILLCDHDPNQLFDAMRKSIILKNTISFEDRKGVIELFKLENIIDKLNNSLNVMISL